MRSAAQQAGEQLTAQQRPPLGKPSRRSPWFHYAVESACPDTGRVLAAMHPDRQSHRPIQSRDLWPASALSGPCARPGADGLVPLVKNESRIEQGFCRAKQLLDHPQLLIFEGHFCGV